MEYKIISCVEKIFSDGRGTDGGAPVLSALRGENISFQIAFCAGEEDPRYFWPEVESPLKECITVRRVESVPARIGRTMENSDEYYLSLEAGMYPDLLVELKGKAVPCPQGQWRALWVEIEVPKEMKAGKYPIALSFIPLEGECLARAEAEIEVIPAELPRQTVLHTEWFHADCLADYYDVPAFSQKHWEIVENFVRTAAKRGVTMLLTPHVTPALDTYIGGERTTVQLVDIKVENGEYSFDFSKLRRWMDMALACGIQQFEMAHLFTQWGAKAAPKVMAEKDGKIQRIFGWDTPAVGGEYTRFLHAYLPELTKKLKEWGMAEKCYFHISDEPNEEKLPFYKAARESLGHLLDGFPIMDAMSHYPIYEESNIQCPVVSIKAVEAFLEKGVEGLWGYYCCGPTQVMTNRFLQMPLHRTRMMGLQWYKYQLAGFLHWGYNFYNTVHSAAPIDPHLDTEAGGYFPAGDGFIVYPGRDGKAEESIRLIAMHYAFQDMRALALLESLIGREETLRILEKDGEITLEKYPRTGEGLLSIRTAVNEAIKKALQA